MAGSPREHKPWRDPLKRVRFRRDGDTSKTNDPANIEQQSDSVNPRKPRAPGLIRQTADAARQMCPRARAALV
jgi:hypothetical protein